MGVAERPVRETIIYDAMQAKSAGQCQHGRARNDIMAEACRGVVEPVAYAPMGARGDGQCMAALSGGV